MDLTGIGSESLVSKDLQGVEVTGRGWGKPTEHSLRACVCVCLLGGGVPGEGSSWNISPWVLSGGVRGLIWPVIRAMKVTMYYWTVLWLSQIWGTRLGHKDEKHFGRSPVSLQGQDLALGHLQGEPSP